MTKKSNKKIELLAPAGNLEKMKTALAHGADAVYAGIPDFSLRVRINDFDLDKIREATEYCHARNKKIYITANIFAHNEHIDKLPEYIGKLRDIGVDALIISDPGIISLVKDVWPEAEIHLSTQANCTNWRAAKFWHDAGVKRVILGREVTLDEIKEIHEKIPDLDLEYFVHGAMCMSYSGRCFLSKYFMDRSGNLGDCIQPCRWKYRVSRKSKVYKVESCLSNDKEIEEELKIENCKLKINDGEGVFISEGKRPDQLLELVEERHGSYILNSKDMCMVRYLGDLAEAGVMSFKIEGRAKSAYYQALVAGIYARVTHSIESGVEEDIDFLEDELRAKIVNRGYTTGFLLGYEKMREAEGQDINNSHVEIDWEFCGQTISRKSKVYKVESHLSDEKNPLLRGVPDRAGCVADMNESEKLEVRSKKLEVRSQREEFKIRNSKFEIGNYLVEIKVHNTLKVGDTVEAVMPMYRVEAFEIRKMFDGQGNEIGEAHGGTDSIITIESDIDIPEFSVFRRKKSS